MIMHFSVLLECCSLGQVGGCREVSCSVCATGDFRAAEGDRHGGTEKELESLEREI